jgi:hypothetical protein
MAGKKKPKSEHGIQVNFRLKKRHIKQLDQHAEEFNFGTRTEVLKWCIQLGDNVLSNNMEELFIQLERFMGKQFGEPSDPNQKDLFQEYKMKLGIEMREGYLQGKQRIKESLAQ